jgi:microcystin-dependent protein
MANPTPYTKGYDFTGYQAVNPTLPLPGNQVDAELSGVATSIAETIVALGEVRRSDGALRNAIVTTEALAVDVRSLLAGDPNPRGLWLTATAYEQNDLVAYSGATYICVVAHVSGTFSTDLAATKWLLIASPVSLSSLGYAEAFSGDGATTTFTLSQSFADILEIDVFVRDGSGGYELQRIVGASPQVTLTSSTQITFATAPAVGTNNVIVRSVSQTASASAGAALGSATAAAASASSASGSASAASSSASSASGSASAASASAAAAAASAASISLPIPIGSGGTGATTAPNARTALGLGTLATVNDVATANLQNNAVTAAKLAREGSSGQVLTSNGAGADPSYQTPAGVPTATILDYGGLTAPSGYLLCDGAAVSRTTYASLWSALSAQATVTITIASPGVVTWNSHPLQNGDPVRLQTTGALPTGLAANTTYYVVSAGANTFQLAATRGGAAINTSGTQSGTHTAIYAPHGWGDNSTTFNVPDLRGRVGAGRDNMGGTAANRMTTAGAGIAGANLGDAGGAQTHTLTTAQLASHNHYMGTNGVGFSCGGPSSSLAGANNYSSTVNAYTGNEGGGSAHQNTQPTVIVNKIIKT